MKRRLSNVAAIVILALSTLPAFGQGAVLQGGGRTAGHVPMYVGTGTGGQTTVQDSGPASGGAVGLGLSELAITSRGTGAPPYVSQGTGPDGTTFCSYDAPTTNATGYHYICTSPNATVGGVTGSVISAGAGGAASQLPLYLCANGSCFTPGSSTPSITVGSTPVAGGTSGGLLYDNSGVLGNIASVGIGQPLVSFLGAAPGYSGAWLYFDTINKFQRITKNATGWTPTNLNTLLHLVGPNSGAETSIEIQTFNTDAVLNGIRANGTASAPTALLANDQINTLASGGYNGSAIAQGPVYGTFASENWTPTNNGSDHRWFLIQTGGTSFTQSMTLRNYNLGVGTETNPKYRITAGKNATAGITSPFGNDGFGAIGADSGGAISYEAIAYSNTPLVNLYRANGTNASKTAVLSGQQMGGVFGNGWDGSSWQVGSGIYFQANQNWSGGVAGSNIGFFTNANGGITSAASMTLSSTGLGIGTTAPKAPLDINSNLSSSPALVVSTSLARMQAADASAGGMEWVSYGATPQNILSGAVAGGTAASPTATPSARSMFNLRGYGYTGSAWANGGLIVIRSSGAWSGSSQGTAIDFYTTNDNSTTIALAAQITPTGGFSIGSTVAGLSAFELGMNKSAAAASAPGAGTAKLAIVAGTNPGTCKLIMYAGTSNTPTTVLDNVGAGC